LETARPQLDGPLNTATLPAQLLEFHAQFNGATGSRTSGNRDHRVGYRLI
jgi:hypothetical protein